MEFQMGNSYTEGHDKVQLPFCISSYNWVRASGGIPTAFLTMGPDSALS